MFRMSWNTLENVKMWKSIFGKKLLNILEAAQVNNIFPCWQWNLPKRLFTVEKRCKMLKPPGWSNMHRHRKALKMQRNTLVFCCYVFSTDCASFSCYQPASSLKTLKVVFERWQYFWCFASQSPNAAISFSGVLLGTFSCSFKTIYFILSLLRKPFGAAWTFAVFVFAHQDNSVWICRSSNGPKFDPNGLFPIFSRHPIIFSS